VGPGRRRQPSTCWINKVTCLAPFLWMQIIGMAITWGIEKIVPRQNTGIDQGVYLKAVGMQFTVVCELPRGIFLTQLRMPIEFPSPHREQVHGCQEAN
jgi:hypothetical protein